MAAPASTAVIMVVSHIIMELSLSNATTYWTLELSQRFSTVNKTITYDVVIVANIITVSHQSLTSTRTRLHPEITIKYIFNEALIFFTVHSKFYSCCWRLWRYHSVECDSNDWKKKGVKWINILLRLWDWCEAWLQLASWQPLYMYVGSHL